MNDGLRRVVTSFLQARLSDDRVLTLLLKRSDKVATFQGRWAGVSGLIEHDDSDALSAARREIAEETGYTAGQIRLARSGRPLLINGRFHVSAFLFELVGAPPGSVDGYPAPAIDWEHDEYEWVDEPTILRREQAGETVPRLWHAYRSVCVELFAARQAVALLRQIEADRRHGSTALALLALDALLAHVDEAARRHNDARTVRQELHDLAHVLACARPSMAVIAGSVADAVAALPSDNNNNNNSDDVAAMRAAVTRAADALRRCSESTARVVAEQVLTRRGMRVLTVSNSSAVQAALLGAGKQCRVTVAASLPWEAADTAARLAHCSPDDVAALAVASDNALLTLPAPDVVLLGADAVLPDGAFVGRTGTGLLCLAAQHRWRCPVYVLASPAKFTASPAIGDDDDCVPPPPELRTAPVAFHYPLFERVPAAPNVRIVSDDGMVDDVRPRCQQSRQRFELLSTPRLFDDSLERNECARK